VLPSNKHRLAFRVPARVFIPLVLRFGMKLPFYVLSKMLPPVLGIFWRKCMIIQAAMDDFSRRPSGPSLSKTDAATKKRLQVEALFANLGPMVHSTEGAVTGTRIHPALTLVCPQPRRRLMGDFSGKLPHTPSATALPQRRNNLVWYPKDGMGPSKVFDGQLNSLRRRYHHESDRAHGPRGKRRCQPRQARSFHHSLFPVHRRPARGMLSMRVVSPLGFVRFYARSAGGCRERYAL